MGSPETGRTVDIYTQGRSSTEDIQLYKTESSTLAQHASALAHDLLNNGFNVDAAFETGEASAELWDFITQGPQTWFESRVESIKRDKDIETQAREYRFLWRDVKAIAGELAEISETWERQGEAARVRQIKAYIKATNSM